MRTILHLSRAEPAELAASLEKTRAHSIDHDLGYWRAVSSVLFWWLRGRTGEVESSSERVRRGLDDYLASGSRLGLPNFQILAADLRRVAGDKQGALDLVRVGEEYIEETGERQSESELFRFKGRLLMTGDDPDPDAAMAAFERAMSVAREQNARLLEIQAATRLAEHQRKTGVTTSAMDRVAELCDWFGPDCGLLDVARARALVTAETMAR